MIPDGCRALFDGRKSLGRFRRSRFFLPGFLKEASCLFGRGVSFAAEESLEKRIERFFELGMKKGKADERLLAREG